MQRNYVILHGTRGGNTLYNLQIHVSLKWSIIDKAKPYSSGSRNCMLCLTEKYHILFLGLNLLNKRNELISKCRHENKYYLSSYKSVSL